MDLNSFTSNLKVNLLGEMGVFNVHWTFQNSYLNVTVFSQLYCFLGERGWILDKQIKIKNK